MANSSPFKKSGSLNEEIYKEREKKDNCSTSLRFITDKHQTRAHVKTFKLFFSSFFLIQLRACCCGSMHKGKRLALVVRMPFCTESSSGGRPSEPHLKKCKDVFPHTQ